MATIKYYSDSPLFNLAVSSFSLITGLDVLSSYKHVPVILNVLYPLFFYAIINKFDLKNTNYLKYSMYLVSIPASGGRSYIVTGTMFAFVFFLGLINQYINLIKKPNRSNHIIFTFLSIIVTLSHPIEALSFFIILMAVSIVINLVDKFDKTYLLNQIFVGLIIIIGWVFLNDSQFRYFGSIFDIGEVSSGPGVPSTLSLLFRASIMGTIKIFFAYYGMMLILTIFLSVSLLYMIKKYLEERKIEPEYKFVIVFLFIVFALTLSGNIVSVGHGYENRVLRNYYFGLMILSGYFFNHISINLGKKILTMIVLLILVVNTAEFYSYPNLVPSASIIFDVPEDTQLVTRGQVNSIYQRELIDFAYNQFEGRIACDKVTRNQIVGLTDTDYYQGKLIWYYPPNTKIYSQLEPKDYDVFMVHFPGISGSFEERADVRDYDTVLHYIYYEDLDLVFSNSQSFMLYN